MFLIEDAAHAQGSAWRGTRVGALGVFGSFSLQESKSLPAGEGGIILTNDDALAERARLLHSIGRQAGQPGYLHYALASNYRLSELQAALLLVQLEYLPEQVAERGKRRGASSTPPWPRPESCCHNGAMSASPSVATTFPSIDTSQQRWTAFPGTPSWPLCKRKASRRHGRMGFRSTAMRPFLREALQSSPLRGLDNVPAYHELHLPVTERVTTREQVTIPHEVLLAGPEGMRPLVDAVTKIAEHRDALRAWWESRSELLLPA